MQQIPAVLAYGLVSIYGIGSNLGINGIRSLDSGFAFGTIYQLGPHVEGGYQVSQTVLFKKTDVICKLAWAGDTFSLVHSANLIINEIPIP